MDQQQGFPVTNPSFHSSSTCKLNPGLQQHLDQATHSAGPAHLEASKHPLRPPSQALATSRQSSHLTQTKWAQPHPPDSAEMELASTPHQSCVHLSP